MNGVIFGEMLRRHWRAALYWGVGLGLLILIQIVALPSNETLQQMGELLDSLPSFITDGMMGAMRPITARRRAILPHSCFWCC